MIQAAPVAAASTGYPQIILKFRYDYLGRRVEKLVIDSVSNRLISGRRFLYDGWNLLAEYALNASLSTLTLVRSYTWGLDIARTLSEAGGVGALLQIADHPSGKTYFPAYDGNGNVTALVNSSTGTVAAAYEYSPFGEQLRADAPDSVVADQPFRFSTKYTDSETGLVYYGRRYYDAKQGRFVGRDPIEEKGGLNLYAFVTNNPTNRWDYLGMISVEDLEAQIDSLRDKKQKLEQEENDAYVSKGTNQGKIDELNTQIEALEAQLAALRQPATQLPSFEVNDDRLPPITVPGVTPQAFRFVIPGINMPISTANALASLNKTIRCAGLANQIDAGNKLFQRFSKDLGDLLEFQRDANLTLYLVDRAIDAAAGIIGGGVGSAVKSASFGSGMAAASSTLTGQLAQSGMVTRAGITTTGKVIRVAEIWVTFGVTGTATGAGVNNALKLAAKLGPDGVRNQIQNTINSLEGDTTRMGTALSDLRAEFNKDCK